MSVRRRPDHSPFSFFRRTVAAQIHALALLLVFGGMAALLPAARAEGSTHFWACLVFLVTGSLLFLTSSVYHFLYDGYEISSWLEHFFEDLDHYCIYLFIAGTYTPVIINLVASPWRTYLLAAVWVIAALGIAYTKLKRHLPPALQSRGVYTGLFLLMGYLIVVRAGEIYARLSPTQLSLFAGGVLAYSLGTVCYVTRRPNFIVGIFGYHELWHLAVLVGAALHFFFIRSLYSAF